ncbi:MAG: LLM class flavin-dependent oxidoreductase [Alphaproteobacteria bacterium]|nr:LLM class flavin-dependent oxidoreductase [Alphaproteobacteria bacterium]
MLTPPCWRRSTTRACRSPRCWRISPTVRCRACGPGSVVRSSSARRHGSRGAKARRNGAGATQYRVEPGWFATTYFGLFGLLGRRDRDKDIGVVIREATEHARLGEQAGFSTAWFAEHHFSNYSLTVSPMMMAAHLGPVTKTIKLGTSVVLGCLYQPASLIVEVAFVDQMCGGRLVLGVGSGYQAQELVRFGVTLEQSR